MNEFTYDELDVMELTDELENASLEAFDYDYSTDDDELRDLLSFD